MNFHFSTGTRGPDELLIELGGELTIFHASELRERLIDVVQSSSGLKTIHLCLQRNTELDTAGLQLLLAFERTLQQRGESLALEIREPAVSAIFQLCQLTLPIVPAEPEAQS